MKPEAQRIAIAEACGWKNCKQYGEQWNHPFLGGQHDKYGLMALPNYLSDLNAMHEAEKDLTHAQMQEYCDMLCDYDSDLSSAITATAAQRAEAFLKTLNLWKE